VTGVWQYAGLSPDQIAKQITTFSEYTISSAVDNVKNIESQTLAGTSVIRIFFQPNVRIDAAIAQVTAVSQTILRRMPPGTQPPFIIRYNASSVPILQLALGSKNLSEAQLYDYGIYRVRQAIAPVRGRAVPVPKRRQAAPSHGRSRSAGVAGQRPFAAGRGQCRQRAKPHPSQRYLENW